MPKKKMKNTFVVRTVSSAFFTFEELPGCCGIGVASDFDEEATELGVETLPCHSCGRTGLLKSTVSSSKCKCFYCAGRGEQTNNNAERDVPVTAKHVLEGLKNKLPKTVLVSLCGQPNAAKAVLEAGFKVLGTCKSRDGHRTITLYGKGFTTPRGKK